MLSNLQSRAVLGLVIGFTCLGLPLAAWAGPISELYLTAGDQGHILVVQGSSVQRSWTATSGFQYPIAVDGGLVRTNASRPTAPPPGGGAEYTAAGAPTGTTYPYPGTILRFFDGTTDGTYNYGIDFDTGGLYQMGTDWSSPSVLFATTTSLIGVTYQASNDSFWIASFATDLIENRARDGSLLSSFNTGVSSMTSLAFDPADATLWFGTQGDLVSASRTFYQYSTAGSLLGTQAFTGLTGENYLGGEFDLNLVPEPASISLVALGALALVLRRRRAAVR